MANRVPGQPYCPTCKSLLKVALAADAHATSGWLWRKKSPLHPKTRRWFVVVDGHLLYYRDPAELGRTLPKGVLHLHEGSAVDGASSGDLLVFFVSGSNKELRLEAQSESDKRHWISRISGAATATSSSPHRGPTMLCPECKAYIDMDSFTLATHVGWLTKRGGDIKTWKRRWVALAGSHLCYYHDPHDVAQLKPIKMLHVAKPGRSMEWGKEFMLTVVSDERTFYFVADNEEDYQGWTKVLKI